jgi:predicted NAD/FAD-dependent oxidoreductase
MHCNASGFMKRTKQMLAFAVAAVPLRHLVISTFTDKIRVNWKLTSISTTPEGLYKLSYDTPEGGATITARSVAMTIPAWALADLLKEQAPAASQALASFDYPPVGAVTLAYPVSAVREDRKAADGSVPGFGQLHPRSQVRIGTGWGSNPAVLEGGGGNVVA